MATLSPQLVLALNPAREEIWAEAGILFYNPDEDNICANMTIGMVTGVVTSGLGATQAAFVDKWQPLASALSVQFGIPWEAVIAKGILESASGTSNFAVNRNNFFGIGAVDSNPGNAHFFPSPEEGWEGYFLFIQRNARYRNHGVFQEPTITDPLEYVAATWRAGYATDPDYVAKLAPLIAAIQARATEQGWESSAELAASRSEMLANAALNAEGANVGAGGFGSIGSDGFCTGINVTGISSQDLNSTAIAFSWNGIPSGQPANNPVPAYFAALQSFNFFNNGDPNVRAGASCDAFVATVVRAANADPNFLCCGTTNQLGYLMNSPLWTEIPNLQNTSNLQAGDIFVLQGHIMILVNDNGAFQLAHASRSTRTNCAGYSRLAVPGSNTTISSCSRTGERGNVFFSDSRGSYRIFRRT